MPVQPILIYSKNVKKIILLIGHNLSSGNTGQAESATDTGRPMYHHQGPFQRSYESSRRKRVVKFCKRNNTLLNNVSIQNIR